MAKFWWLYNYVYSAGDIDAVWWQHLSWCGWSLIINIDRLKNVNNIAGRLNI